MSAEYLKEWIRKAEEDYEVRRFVKGLLGGVD
jgi:hypothetical protein